MKRSFEANQTHSVLTLDDMHLFNSYAMEKELYKMNNFTDKDIKNAKSFIIASSDTKPSFNGVPDSAIIAWANSLVLMFNEKEEKSEFKLAEQVFAHAEAIAGKYVNDNGTLIQDIIDAEKIPTSGVLATTIASYGDVSVVRTIVDRYLQSLPVDEKPIDPLELAEIEAIETTTNLLNENIGSKGFKRIHKLYCTAKGKGKTMARSVYSKAFGEDIEMKKRKGKGKVKLVTMPRYEINFTIGAPIE